MTPPTTTDSGRDYFDSLGADWDRLREGFFSDRIRERMLAVAGVEAGREAADIGAGTGFLTQGLLARGVRVVAIDRSAVMLRALRLKFPRADRVHCRSGEAERLPVADASVDYCLANMCLHHVERPAVAIKEMARILKPGGRAVVADLNAHDFEWLREEHHDRWMGFAHDDVRRWFLGAGFADVTVEGLGEECCTNSDDGRGAAVEIFIASGTR